MTTPATTQQVLAAVSNSQRLFIILLLGFSSGLPAGLTASTLQAWFTDAGLNLHLIGGLTLLVFPYSFRFLWSPLFDYFRLPGIDRRRGWLLITQFGLIASISIMALCTPQQNFNFYQWHIPVLMIWGFITAFLSSSQDIVISAYQTEVLPPEEQGLGAAVYVMGWRISAILSGALALVFAKAWGWENTYLIMAACMSIGILASLYAPVPTVEESRAYSFISSAIAPLKEFFQRYKFKTAFVFFLLLLTYKASDALALALNTTFLLRHMNFDLATLGLVNKTVSMIAALLGGVVAGLWMRRLSLYHALLLFGFIQGVANLGYAALAYWGKSMLLLIFTAFTENFCSGMGSIALVALIMALCNVQYTATQFALLSALAFMARTFVGPVAASLVDLFGWQEFFILCFLLSLPTLLFVYANKTAIQALRK